MIQTSPVMQPIPKPAGTWDYWGKLDPSHWISRIYWQTFSVGVFQWIAKSNGKGVKRGKSIKRFSGFVADPECVYRQVRAFIEEQEKGER